MERVARAIWRTRENQFPERVRRPEPDTFDNASGAWDMVLDQARAAIEAMRIITEDDVWLLASAAENLRGGSQDEETRVTAAFRIASRLDEFRARIAALKD